MTMSKATFVCGPNKRLPTPAPTSESGPPERVMRLGFHIQNGSAAAVLPTLVTRDSGAAAAGGWSVIVPRQAFLMAPLATLTHTHSDTRQAAPLPFDASGGVAAAAAASPAARLRAVVPAPSPHVDVAGVSLPGYAPGYKDVNQDSALLLDCFLSNRRALAAVFDGHGPEGHRVSAFARHNLPFTLLAQLVQEGQDRQGQQQQPQEHEEQQRQRQKGQGHDGEDSSRGGAAAAGGATDGCCEGPLPRALWRAVTSLDEQLADSGIDVVNSGTTAAMCHVHGRRVTAAWVGDSRLLLGLPAAQPREAGNPSTPPLLLPRPGALDSHAAAAEGRGLIVPTAGAGQEVLVGGDDGGGGDAGGGVHGGGGWRVAWSSRDHKPEEAGEAERILAAGGRVARSVGRHGPVGPYRVWFQDQAYPGLAMSRALGDLPGRQIGVTAIPSCASLRLPDRGPALLVLASDGVWELLSNEQVLAAAAGANSAAEAASRVVQQSRRAWVKEYGGSYIDDITAIVMRFDMPPSRPLPPPTVMRSSQAPSPQPQQ